MNPDNHVLYSYSYSHISYNIVRSITIAKHYNHHHYCHHRHCSLSIDILMVPTFTFVPMRHHHHRQYHHLGFAPSLIIALSVLYCTTTITDSASNAEISDTALTRHTSSQSSKLHGWLNFIKVKGTSLLHGLHTLLHGYHEAQRRLSTLQTSSATEPSCQAIAKEIENRQTHVEHIQHLIGVSARCVCVCVRLHKAESIMNVCVYFRLCLCVKTLLWICRSNLVLTDEAEMRLEAQMPDAIGNKDLSETVLWALVKHFSPSIACILIPSLPQRDIYLNSLITRHLTVIATQRHCSHDN